jgi:CDP-glucose 4,6-dehydratase
MEDMVVRPNRSFWQGKRVLITGHTGFKGSWLAQWLVRLGANVSGIALPPKSEPNLFALADVAKRMDSYYCDIRQESSLRAIVHTAHPDIVFHLAAQPLVRASYRDPVETIAVNVMGTTHMLDALRTLDPVRVAVLVTTDKVYRNREWLYPYREEDPLGGHDPYSASKAASEMIIDCYRTAYFSARGIAVGTARAGNVIGGGDWSEDRLIPDAVRAWQAQTPLVVRRPNAVRPWQHVLDPLCGYIRLAETLWQAPHLAGAYNFGPLPQESATVRKVVDCARMAYGEGAVEYGDGQDGPHEADTLELEVSKARAVLGVVARWPLSVAVERTMRWYRRQTEAVDAGALCDADLRDYEDAA